MAPEYSATVLAAKMCTSFNEHSRDRSLKTFLNKLYLFFLVSYTILELWRHVVEWNGLYYKKSWVNLRKKVLWDRPGFVLLIMFCPGLHCRMRYHGLLPPSKPSLLKRPTNTEISIHILFWFYCILLLKEWIM